MAKTGSWKFETDLEYLCTFRETTVGFFKKKHQLSWLLSQGEFQPGKNFLKKESHSSNKSNVKKHWVSNRNADQQERDQKRQDKQTTKVTKRVYLQKVLKKTPRRERKKERNQFFWIWWIRQLSFSGELKLPPHLFRLFKNRSFCQINSLL